MSFLKRMFSADFRRAVAAEAAGDYSEAARAYALAGEHAKVAEMHLLRAERAPSPEARLQELRAAVRWADPEDEDGRSARRRIARALFVWAKQAGVVSEADRAVVREAAQLFAEGRDHSGEGECHELLGDELAAAEAYQRAGDLERLESVLSREEARRRHKHRVADAYEEYRLQLAAGERDLALEALRVCVAGSAEPELSGYRRELEALEARLLTDGIVRLALGGAAAGSEGGRDTLYAGAFPLSLGREAIFHVALRDAGISRRHCEVLLSGGKFALRDLHSKNGTILGGVPVAPGGTLPLDGEGELGVGEHCGMRFRAAYVPSALLTLEVVRGLDRGLRILASPQPFTLGPAHALTLSFRDGRPRLSAPEPLSLNQARAGTNVQLCRGDQIELGHLKVEVR